MLLYAVRHVAAADICCPALCLMMPQMEFYRALPAVLPTFFPKVLLWPSTPLHPSGKGCCTISTRLFRRLSNVHTLNNAVRPPRRLIDAPCSVDIFFEAKSSPFEPRGGECQRQCRQNVCSAGNSVGPGAKGATPSSRGAQVSRSVHSACCHYEISAVHRHFFLFVARSFRAVRFSAGARAEAVEVERARECRKSTQQNAMSADGGSMRDAVHILSVQRPEPEGRQPRLLCCSFMY